MIRFLEALRNTALVLSLLSALWPTAARSQASVYMCVELTTGIDRCQHVSVANPLPVSGTFTPSGTSPEFTPVTPATATATKGVLLGTQYNSTQATFTDGQQGSVQASARGALLVATGADTFTASAAQSGTWTVQPGNTPNTTAWLVTPTPSSAAGAAVTSASSTAAASNLVLKASAGNLYSLTITIGATSGYAMLFDATSLPSNGAVTPVWCYPVTSNGTNGGAAVEFSTPKRFGTGITAGFSTTGCFTLTASATGNFFGGYQ